MSKTRSRPNTSSKLGKFSLDSLSRLGHFLPSPILNCLLQNNFPVAFLIWAGQKKKYIYIYIYVYIGYLASFLFPSYYYHYFMVFIQMRIFFFS